MSLKVSIIGCGLIGKKRAASLKKSQLRMVYDTDLGRASELSKNFPECRIATSPEEAAKAIDVDVVIIATPNHLSAPYAKMAMNAGKHVLIEKPGAISIAQMQELIDVEKKTNVKVRIGFNHRYHPAFLKLNELRQTENLGPLMFVRGRYGHGGRVGYESEWRADPRLSGGGELMDQGVHLIDLSLDLLGDIETVDGHAATYFWKMPVDDNAFVSLRNKEGKTAWLQVSCTEWKNLFSFEVYFKEAKLHIEGLGGSYGVERISYFKMLPQMGPPDVTVFEYPRGDDSWRVEIEEFFKDILENRAVKPGLSDTFKVIQAVETVYERSGYLSHAKVSDSKSPKLTSVSQRNELGSTSP